MKTININELKEKYLNEVDCAYERTMEMINNKDFSNTNLEDGYQASLDWAFQDQEQMELFDSFIDKSIYKDLHDETIVAHKSKDADMVEIAKQDYRKFKRKK